ncbi:MAG TPA: hypothetical protein ENN63_03080 [Bacteroidetes bacterium]|nr:hypothetical protein [Bacteroidota bacterium]
MKTFIQIILAIAIVILGYLLVESIMNPIRFNRERVKREKAAISRLEDIRTAQIAFKAEKGRYTGSFDTLISFVKNDSFSVVKSIGSIPDSLYDALGPRRAEIEALRKGLITRDTIRVAVLDSLFDHGYPIDSLRYVPFTNGKEFFLGRNVIETASGVKVDVFEANVLNDVLLKGLDPQLIINYNEERLKITDFPGLRLGSLKEATNNAGNWEK